MAVCPVCGCKTDELDFIQGKIGTSEVKMCSFCNKQLGAFDGEGEPSEGQLRWLSSVLSKEVPERDDEISQVLLGLQDKFGREETVQEPVQAYNGATPTSRLRSDYTQAELLERVESLERQLKALKRSIRIKSILEVCIPVILGIILILVIVTSDAFESLSQLYNFFV